MSDYEKNLIERQSKIYEVSIRLNVVEVNRIIRALNFAHSMYNYLYLYWTEEGDKTKEAISSVIKQIKDCAVHIEDEQAKLRSVE